MIQNTESIQISSKFGKDTKEQLIEFIKRYQNRKFAEEIEFIQSKEGEQWIQKTLQTDFRNGLVGNDLEEREKYFGSNKKEEIARRSYCEILLGTLDDFTLKVLIGAAIISIVINMIVEENHRDTAWIEGFAILIAVMISSNVQAINDYQKDKQFQELNKVADERKQFNVIRNGVVQLIHSDNIVVGDVIQIFEGMEIPGDSLLIEGHEVTTDESSMTGEADPMKKQNLRQCIEAKEDILKENSKNISDNHTLPSPAILSGTTVLSGEGRLLILVVGQYSCVGKIQALIEQEAEITPLQQKLETIARDIGKFGLYSGILTLIVLFIRITVTTLINDYNFVNYTLPNFVQAFIIGVTVVVVAIPEGLPLAVTISLAFSVKKMLADQNLVKKLQACETMGGASMICSDKTGTLTMNKMYLTSIWNGQYYEIDIYQNNYILDNLLPQSSHEILMQAINCNSSASLRPLTGSKTEIAGLEFTDKCNYQYEQYREKYLKDEYFRIPFTSKRKRMSTILENVDNNTPHKKRMHTKGASEIVLECCSSLLDWRTNEIVQITPELRSQMEDVIYHMAKRALRTICLGYKEINGNEDLTTKDDKGVYQIEKSGFICIALFGIMDALRQEVPNAVKQCKVAGIKVRMVTGDNKITARAIAINCGITTEDSDRLVLEGAEFIERVGGIICKKCRSQICPCPRDKETAKKQGMQIREDTIANAEEFDRIYPKLDVLARSRPEDKYALVTGLMERGYVVAVTGDGTNDAPALKKANVGFAMGISGTSVAKEAADIILMDDNFASIVKAVMWGRNIYDSIQKFLQFQLTVNLVAVVSVFLGAAAVKMSVLTAVQLLWVNLIMDTFASLALSTEPPTEQLLLRKPHSKNEYIITKKMLKHIIGQAILQVLIILTVVFAGPQIIPEYKTSDRVIFNPEKPVYQNQDGQEYGYIHSGLQEDYNDKDYTVLYGPSRHLTLVFNIFVWLQIINFFNSRKLSDEKNVFEGILKSKLFILMLIIIIVLQVIIVTFGNFPLNCHKDGLTIEQWGISIGFGLLSFLISGLLRYVPESKICPEAGNKMTNPIKERGGIMSFKRPSNEQKLIRKYSGLVGGSSHRLPSQPKLTLN